jgi:basic membrane lipoprotein Med (substrate-binding protein (PBP1-ABC) superfamily)
MKVALITPGPISDRGWNASANQGLQRIQTELGAQIAPPVEKPGLAEVAGVLRNLAQQGNHLIFLHGSEFDDAAKEVAPDFPRTTFVVVGGRSVGPNLTPIQFASGEATYLAGMVAGGMTRTGKIGCVGAAEIPIVKAAFASFTRGAKAARPDADVRVTWAGDESDPGKAKQQAQALLDAGADVLTHNANAAGQGVFQAVSEKPGAMVIGANADQSDQATAQNLGSFIVDAANAYLSVARVVQQGKGTGKPFAAGLKDGAVGFKYNTRFAGKIPEDLKARVEKARADIIAGSLDPGAA